MGPRIWAVVALSGGLLAGGCSHTHFQVRPDRAERARIEDTFDRLRRAVASGDPARLVGVVDPTGRKALLTFALARLLDRLDGVEDSLEAAVLVAAAAGAWVLSEAAADRDRGTGELAAGLERSFAERLGRAAEAGGRGLWKWAGRLVGPQPAFDPADLEDLAAHLLGQCRPPAVIVAYRTGLMRYRDWGKAEYSYAFRRFKDELERLTFVRLDCPDEVGLFVLARYDDQPRPRVLLWWFFPPAEWRLVDRKLTEWFELDN